MTNTREVRIGDHKLKFIDGKPAIGAHATDEPFTQLTLEDVGALAEFAAEAWIALADEEYRPVIITENGYVADPGHITLGPASTAQLAEALDIGISVGRDTVAIEDALAIAQKLSRDVVLEDGKA